MWTVEYWRAVGERCVWTFAQALLAILSVGATELLSVPWPSALATAGLAALLSVLKSIAANGVGDHGPSFGTERLPAPADTHGRHERDQ